MAPTPNRDQAASSRTTEIVLNPQEEFALLLKGVEEASKHARGILFVLVSTSAFILIAAYSSANEGIIKLPLVAADVPRSEFFFIGPVILLFIYVYLQLYVQELIGRLDRIDNFQSSVHLHAQIPSDLLFPWILVFAEEQHRLKRGHTTSGADAFARYIGQYKYAVPFTRMFAICLIWLLGPFTLLLLSVRFLTDVNEVAIMPTSCFVVASVIAGRFIFPKRRLMSDSFIGIFGLLFIFFTLASIPSLRRISYLDVTWELSRPAIVATLESMPMMLLYGAAIGTPVLFLILVGRYAHSRLMPWRRYLNRLAEELLLVKEPFGRDAADLAAYYADLGLAATSGEEISGSALIKGVESAVLLGKPGAGKTVLLRYIGWKLAKEGKGRRSPRFIPVFVRLRELAVSQSSIEEYTATVFREYGADVDSERLARLIDSGCLVYLFDGLDEVPIERRDEVVGMIRELLARDVARVFVTVRLGSYHGELDRDVEFVLTLRPMDEEAIRRFVEVRLRDQRELAQQLLRELWEQKALMDAARNPLLLSMLVSVFQRIGEMPTVDRLIDMQLGEWDSLRGIQQEFTRDEKLTFLKALARRMDEENVRMLSEGEALAVAEACLSAMGASRSKAEHLLREGLRSGLLVKVQEGVEFAHLAIQEKVLSMGSPNLSG